MNNEKDRDKLDQQVDEALQEAIGAAKGYAGKFRGLLIPLGGVGGLAALEDSFLAGLQFGCDRAFYLHNKTSRKDKGRSYGGRSKASG